MNLIPEIIAKDAGAIDRFSDKFRSSGAAGECRY
jgi:hypothetical protein